jgi:WD40 repeat protein
MHNGKLLSIKWDKNGQRLATAANGGPVRIFDFDDGSLLDLMKLYATQKMRDKNNVSIGPRQLHRIG